MGPFDEINKELFLTALSPMEMNKIHFETGRYTPIDNSDDASPVQKP